MSQPYIGEIMLVGFNYAPLGWAFCNGQVLPISGNDVLFAILGTTYGGDGQTTFALPDLRGRVLIHQGQGLGLGQYQIGQTGGSEAVTLGASQLPAHIHALNASTNDANSIQPNTPAVSPASLGFAYSSSPNAAANYSSSTVGGSQPHSNIMPFLTLNYIIALEGIFPSQN